MSQKPFLVSYVGWHYSRAFGEIWNTTLNYIWATYHFFSVPLLLQTFFKPWHRLDVEYGKGMGIDSFFGPLIVNTLMRIVGMIMRLIIILIGLVGTVIIFLLGIAVTAAWIFLPLIFVYLIWQGLLRF